MVVVAFSAWLIFKDESEPGSPAPPVVERTRDQLEQRDGKLFEPEASEPFTGMLVEYYPEKKPKIAIEIQDGRPHGLSCGWYENGQMEVEERFVSGVSHGQRTRWHENGQKRSEAQIENGQITGKFFKWHDNGQKAAEATLVNGKPDGVSEAWHESGAPKSRVELRDGEIVSKEYFAEANP